MEAIRAVASYPRPLVASSRVWWMWLSADVAWDRLFGNIVEPAHSPHLKNEGEVSYYAAWCYICVVDSAEYGGYLPNIIKNTVLYYSRHAVRNNVRI